MTTKFDNLPEDVRELVKCLENLLMLYMPGTFEVTMLVGRNCKATLKIHGGHLTRDVIEDTMAHLAFYKRYFPKEVEKDGKLTSPEQVIDAMCNAWTAHRAVIEHPNL